MRAYYNVLLRNSYQFLSITLCRDTERNKEIGFLEAQVYEYVEILGVSWCSISFSPPKCSDRTTLMTATGTVSTGAEAADSWERPEETGPDRRGTRGRGGGAAQWERERRRRQWDHLQPQEPAAGLGRQGDDTSLCMNICPERLAVLLPFMI